MMTDIELLYRKYTDPVYVTMTVANIKSRDEVWMDSKKSFSKFLFKRKAKCVVMNEHTLEFAIGGGWINKFYVFKDKPVNFFHEVFIFTNGEMEDGMILVLDKYDKHSVVVIKTNFVEKTRFGEMNSFYPLFVALNGQVENALLQNCFAPEPVLPYFQTWSEILTNKTILDEPFI